MRSIKTDQASVADKETGQNRREALKRFGRYAAAAPTAMILLEPRVGHAGGGRRGGSRGGGRGGSPY